MQNPRAMRNGDEEFKGPRSIGNGRARTLSPNEDPKSPRPVDVRKKHSNGLEAAEEPRAFLFSDEQRDLHRDAI